MSGRKAKSPVSILVLKGGKHVPRRRSPSTKYFQEFAGFTQSPEGEMKREFKKVKHYKEQNNNDGDDREVFVSNRVPYIVVQHCDDTNDTKCDMEGGMRSFHKSFSAPNLRKNLIGNTLRR